MYSDHTNKTDVDVTTINDVMRASLVAANEAGVQAALARVIEVFGEPAKIKDRFAEPVGGYRDYMLQINLPNGRKAEFQIHRADQIWAKEVAIGHVLYEFFRDVDAAIKHRERTLPEDAVRTGEPDVLEQWRARVSEEGQALYDLADALFRESASRNASSVGNSPASPNPVPITQQAALRGGNTLGGSTLNVTLPTPGTDTVSSSNPSSKNRVPAGNLSGTSNTSQSSSLAIPGNTQQGASGQPTAAEKMVRDYHTRALVRTAGLSAAGSRDVHQMLDVAATFQIGATPAQTPAQLFNAHRELAAMMARQFANIPNVADGEVEQEALLALHDASRNYDPTRNVPFRTYANTAMALGRHSL